MTIDPEFKTAAEAIMYRVFGALGDAMAKMEAAIEKSPTEDEELRLEKEYSEALQDLIAVALSSYIDFFETDYEEMVAICLRAIDQARQPTVVSDDLLKRLLNELMRPEAPVENCAA